MRNPVIFLSLILILFLNGAGREKPSIILIGDSTVRNGSGNGSNGQWGWGDYLHEQVDTNRVKVINKALGGRSSRTFISQGWWLKAKSLIKPGDFVVIQFGHNDTSPVNDTLRARGTLRGTGNETEEIDNMITHEHEIVHTYGWYLRQYVKEIKELNATPIICSPVVRNNWKDGKIVRGMKDYGVWAKQIADEYKLTFVDLNDLTAKAYEVLGPDQTKEKIFHGDNTHTSLEGAKINARCFAQGIASSKSKLKRYLKK